MNTVPTLICAYCNAARQPGHPCPCGVQQTTGAARTRELARHRELEREGVAPRDVKKYIGGRN